MRGRSSTGKSVALRADMQKGMADVEAGHVRDFDAERIVEKALDRDALGTDD